MKLTIEKVESITIDTDDIPELFRSLCEEKFGFDKLGTSRYEFDDFKNNFLNPFFTMLLEEIPNEYIDELINKLITCKIM